MPESGGTRPWAVRRRIAMGSPLVIESFSSMVSMACLNSPGRRLDTVRSRHQDRSIPAEHSDHPDPPAEKERESQVTNLVDLGRLGRLSRIAAFEQEDVFFFMSMMSSVKG
jgi:hypothetical protein